MWLNSKTIAAVGLTIMLSGCKNLYTDFGSKTSNDYLLYEAEKDLDALRFDSAINNLDVVLARVPDDSYARYMKSVAHSGRAGLRVVQIFETLSSSGSASIFQILAESFHTINDFRLDDFKVAVDSLEYFSTDPGDRTSEQNFYALFLFLGRIGAVLNRYAYDNNNALLSTTFSACHKVVDKSAVTTGIPDDAIDIIMTMIPRITDTVQKLSEQGSGNLFDVSSLQALGVFSYDPIPCSADSNAPKCLAIRTIINNNSTGLGLGTGSGPEAIACLAAVP